MKTNNKSNDIDNSKNDIIYFVKNIMQINLKSHEELLLKKLIEAKESGKDLVFIPFIPRTLQDIDLQCKHYGKNTKCVIFDESDSK
jgi:hypothetical protein